MEGPCAPPVSISSPEGAPSLAATIVCFAHRARKMQLMMIMIPATIASTGIIATPAEDEPEVADEILSGEATEVADTVPAATKATVVDTASVAESAPAVFDIVDELVPVAETVVNFVMEVVVIQRFPPC